MMAGHPCRLGSLLLESNEFLTIKGYLEQSLGLEDYIHGELLAQLVENIQHAVVVDEHSMPDDVVRLHTHVTLESSTGAKHTFQLVPPKDADREKGKYSVVGAMGCSIIGLSKGDTLIYGIPGHATIFRIVEVDQIVVTTNVEANGEIHSDSSKPGQSLERVVGSKETRGSTDDQCNRSIRTIKGKGI